MNEYAYRHKSIMRQVLILHRLGIFPPNISPCVDIKAYEQRLPAGAETWFAIPRWKLVAGTYAKAVEKVLNKLQYARGDLDFSGRIKFLSQHEHTIKKFEEISNQQNGYSILVIAAQFGWRHRDRSVQKVREIFTENEFGLGAFEIGCMILTHPDRFFSDADLWILCSGNECNLPGDIPIFTGDIPIFIGHRGKLKFDGGSPSTIGIKEAYSFYGSPTGFVP